MQLAAAVTLMMLVIFCSVNHSSDAMLFNRLDHPQNCPFPLGDLDII